jgi:hypothetical protein
VHRRGGRSAFATIFGGVSAGGALTAQNVRLGAGVSAVHGDPCSPMVITR